MSKIMRENFYRLFLLILGIASILVNIKCAYMNYNTDVDYAVTMSYRIINGDDMFLQMWEPHQTSAFLATFFMRIYLGIFGTTTGVTLFLNFIGIIIKAGITLFIYIILKEHVNSTVLYLMCLFFFTVNPKNFVFPEFSNMQLWFSVLLFGMLFRYFQNQKKKSRLVLAAAALCLEIISYPSCVIVYFCVAGLLFLYSYRKWRDLLIFSLSCFAGGAVYIGWFLKKVGVGSFWDAVRNIVNGDGSHGVSFVDKFEKYFIECGQSLLFLMICLLIAVILTKLYTVVFKREKRISYLLSFLVVLCGYHFFSALFVGDRYRYLAIFPAVILCGGLVCRECDKAEKMIYVIGAVLSLGALTATLMLTNLTFLTSVAYMILGVMVSFVPIGRYLETRWSSGIKIASQTVLVLFCAVTIFRSGFLAIYGDYVNASIFYILKEPKIIQYGPLKGIVTDYFSGYVINETAEEWSEYVQEQDSILIVTSEYLSSTAYMFADTEIAAPSTICTPTYDEQLLRYWELYPEKYPDVVIVSCWNGELKVSEDSYIMHWLENEFQADRIQDGAFWRYYRRSSQE